MSDYIQYVTAINKIFDYLSKMKAGWNSLDNQNYIESIEEYRKMVINGAERLKQINATPPKKEPVENLEALGND